MRLSYHYIRFNEMCCGGSWNRAASSDIMTSFDKVIDASGFEAIGLIDFQIFLSFWYNTAHHGKRSVFGSRGKKKKNSKSDLCRGREEAEWRGLLRVVLSPADSSRWESSAVCAFHLIFFLPDASCLKSDILHLVLDISPPDFLLFLPFLPLLPSLAALNPPPDFLPFLLLPAPGCLYSLAHLSSVTLDHPPPPPPRHMSSGTSRCRLKCLSMTLKTQGNLGENKTSRAEGAGQQLSVFKASTHSGLVANIKSPPKNKPR